MKKKPTKIPDAIELPGVIALRLLHQPTGRHFLWQAGAMEKWTELETTSRIFDVELTFAPYEPGEIRWFVVHLVDSVHESKIPDFYLYCADSLEAAVSIFVETRAEELGFVLTDEDFACGDYDRKTCEYTVEGLPVDLEAVFGFEVKLVRAEWLGGPQ